VSTPPEPDPYTTNRGQQPSGRLNRVQQLTLTTWRHASASVARHVMPNDILAHVAIHAVLGALRDTSDPLDLFVRHQHGEEEFALVSSLAAADHCRDELFNLFDTGFLLRWQELTSDGHGPEELPPLRRAMDGSQRLLP
jgi:hypothetical protein